MKSAVARLQAMGMFHTTAIRKNAFISGSWGKDSGDPKRKLENRYRPLRSWLRFVGLLPTVRFQACEWENRAPVPAMSPSYL